MASPAVESPLLTEALVRVEAELLESVRARDPFLTEVASHLITAGGKRVRPAFTVAAALTAPGAVPEASRESVLGGVAVELVHLGSLYHDDVMDDATMRRTVETVNAKWGNLRAILAGDYLLAKASEIAAGLGTEVAGLLAATIGRLCEGQVAELQDTYDAERTEERYTLSISGKTASLFGTACRIGGIVAGLDRDRIDALTTFGDRYGMAFQVVDDVLDVVATDEELGKPAGHDLVEGVYTLPVLRMLGTSRGEELRDMLGRVLDDAEREKARDLVRADPDAVGESVESARVYVNEAVAAVEPFGRSEAGAWMVGAARGLLERVDDVTG